MVLGYPGFHRKSICALATRVAFKTELEECLQQYVDDDLADRIQDRVRDAQEDAYRALREAFDENAASVGEPFDELLDAIDSYESRLEDDVEATKQGLERMRDREHSVRREEGLDDARSRLREALTEINVGDVLESVDVDVPEAESPGADQPLLDTNRGLLQQLAAYKDYDIRD